MEDRGTEADLVEQARRGDVAAFEALVHAHQEVCFRTAWIVSGGTDDAEDAAQDGLFKAFHALSRFRPGSPFRPWLLTIVANEARNRRRSAIRREALADRVSPSERSMASARSAESTALARERLTALVAALDRLRAEDRDVIALRHLVGLSEAETAAALGIPPGTAKSRLSRALARLREELGETRFEA